MSDKIVIFAIYLFFADPVVYHFADELATADPIHEYTPFQSNNTPIVIDNGMEYFF